MAPPLSASSGRPLRARGGAAGRPVVLAAVVTLLLLVGVLPMALPSSDVPPARLLVWDLPDDAVEDAGGNVLSRQGALTVVEVPTDHRGAFASAVAQRGGSVATRPDGTPVVLSWSLWGERYALDGAASRPPLPPEGPLLAHPLDTTVYVVSFAVPPGAEQWRALRAAGFSSLPTAFGPATWLALGTPSAAVTLQQRADVAAVLPYHPLWRVAPPLRAALPALGGSPLATYDVEVIFVPMVEGDDDLQVWLTAHGLSLRRVEHGRGWGTSGLLHLDGAQLQALARRPDLQQVAPAPTYHFTNTDATGVIQSGIDDGLATPLYAAGINGSGRVIGIADSGIDYDHLVFRDTLSAQGTASVDHRKVVSYDTSIDGWDEVGHGTHVVGTAVGDSLTTPRFPDLHDGIAFGAKVSFYDISSTAGGIIPPSLPTLFDRAMADGATTHSDSWLTNSTLYDADSLALDQYSWDHPTFLSVFSAGNEGPGATTIESPGNAKDTIAVGNALNGLTSGIDDTSSRGPSITGAYGPLLLAPGMPLVSALGDGAPNTLNEGYVAQGGTSMATPVAAAAAVLVEDYFAKGFYPSGSATAADSRSTSGPLRRAILVAGSVDQHGGTSVSGYAPDNDQGFGKVALDQVLELSGNGRDLWVQDAALPGQQVPLFTGQQMTYQVSVASGLPLVVALAYHDAPGATLIDDLDLVVTAPGGEEYHGNVLSNGSSIPTIAVDSANTNELVRIPTPAAGEWNISVQARVVGHPDGQSFALVATGQVSTLPDVGFDLLQIKTLPTNLTTEGGAPLALPVQVRGPAFGGNVSLAVAEASVTLTSVDFLPSVSPETIVSVPLLLSAGTHQLHLTLDPLGVVSEEREDNNDADLTVWVNIPPMAALDATPDPALRGDPVLLDASRSTDEGPLRYRIDPGDGSGATWSNQSSLEHTYVALGTYSVTLTVEDNRSAEATVTIPLAVLDHPPVAELEVTPTEALTLTDLTFDGTGSGDPDGDSTLTFDFGDGTVRTDVAAVQTYAYGNDGVYSVRLTVRDSLGQEEVAIAAVTIHDRPPQIDSADGPAQVEVGASATFTATASDADGSVAEFGWHFGDGIVGSGATVRHVYSAPADLTVQVYALDDDGFSSEIITLAVRVVTGAPVVSIIGPREPIPTLLPVLLRGVVTDTAEGTLEYLWNWSGGTAVGPSATVVPQTPGTFEVTLQVTNGAGLRGNASIVLVASDRPPIPVITVSSAPVIGVPLTLSGAQSTDLDGTIRRYEWRVGSVTGQCQTLTLTPSDVGPMVVHLLVVDDFGLGANASIELQVLDSVPVDAGKERHVLDSSVLGSGIGLLLLVVTLLAAAAVAVLLELTRRRHAASPPQQPDVPQ